MTLRLVLLAPQGTVHANGKARIDVVRDLCDFIRRLSNRGTQVAIWSRHRTTLDNEPLDEYLTRESGVPVHHYLAAAGQYPARQYAGSVDPILQELNIQRHEAILVGSGTTDFRAGVNNKLLLVRPAWYGEAMEYGFRVGSIGELARFCEVFALRQHPIGWSINDGSLQVRSMAPFSTYRPELAEYGADARNAAKHNLGDPNFWFLAVVSSLYFSGVMHTADYICSYPGHNPAADGSVRQVLDRVLTQFGKCFRKTYLPDLIVRHTASRKSQHLKAHERTFTNQLNTIHLNIRPRSYDHTEPRKTPLPLRGKCVLVVDDFITHGRSLDVARAYLEAAGARAVLFSWLKTISMAFEHMASDPSLRPFTANHIRSEPTSIRYGFDEHIVAPQAQVEIQQILEAYRTWSWP